MAIAKYLIDKSVLARAAQPSVRDRLNSLNDRGLLATCAMVEMEMLFSVRNATERDQLRGFLNRFDWIPIMDEVWQRATQVQCELVDKGLHRSAKIPDLVIAAAAERHGVTVLHYDRDFDRIAEVTGQLVEWAVPRGSAD